VRARKDTGVLRKREAHPRRRFHETNVVSKGVTRLPVAYGLQHYAYLISEHDQLLPARGAGSLADRVPEAVQFGYARTLLLEGGAVRRLMRGRVLTVPWSSRYDTTRAGGKCSARINVIYHARV
jgi:hypothetical protein